MPPGLLACGTRLPGFGGIRSDLGKARKNSWLKPIWQSFKYVVGLASPFLSLLEAFALLALGRLRSSGLGPHKDGEKRAFFFFLSPQEH